MTMGTGALALALELVPDGHSGLARDRGGSVAREYRAVHGVQRSLCGALAFVFREAAQIFIIP